MPDNFWFQSFIQNKNIETNEQAGTTFRWLDVSAHPRLCERNMYLGIISPELGNLNFECWKQQEDNKSINIACQMCWWLGLFWVHFSLDLSRIFRRICLYRKVMTSSATSSDAQWQHHDWWVSIFGEAYIFQPFPSIVNP